MNSYKDNANINSEIRSKKYYETISRIVSHAFLTNDIFRDIPINKGN